MATITSDVEREENESDSRPLTIGAVCRRLQAEFPDISISKIRYLEDQGLMTPRRTQGGYRLFTDDDVDRLEMILRLEREDFGLLQPRVEDGTRFYPERDIDVVAACLRLARYGVEARNLRSFRAGADREAGLLEQIVAPALRSRNPERRQGGLEDLEALASLSQELSQLLFWRALRSLVPR